MPESTTPAPFEREREGEPLGLSLSELLGEVWAPVGRLEAADLPEAASATDPDPGDTPTWNP
jgi:hypothetical protein